MAGQHALVEPKAAAQARGGPSIRGALRQLARPARLKPLLAATCEHTGINALGLLAQKRLGGAWARAVNYHDVPPRLASRFEAQLRYFARHFVSVGPAELEALHAGDWPHPKPGLLLTFDDGLRSHADVVAPLIEEYGFTGWFNVPIGFVETPPEQQPAFADAHRIDCDASDFPDARIALDWRDLHRLDASHEICCHTSSHRRLGPRLSDEELSFEIDDAKRRLEDGLGHPVRGFAWVGGEDWAYSAEAAERIRAAGFRFSFMTNNAVIRPNGDLLQLQRTNVEAHFDPALLHLSMSGLYDWLYLSKRRRVNRRTRAPTR